MKLAARLRLLNRRDRAITLIGALAVVGFFALLVLARVSGNVNTGDTNNLVAGARTALHCVRTGVLHGCGLVPPRQTTVGPYPLLQYIPAALMLAIGASDHTALVGLSWLSMVSFVGCIAMAVRLLRRQPIAAAVAVAALIGSTLTYQATSSFGEVLAAATVLLAVMAARNGGPWRIVVAFALAGVVKETMPPFLILIGLVALPPRPNGRLPTRKHLAAVCAGSIAAVVVSGAFNVFRFANIRNLLYLDPILATPGIGRKLNYFLAQWFAPAGGIAFFWPLTALVLFAVGVRLIVGLARRRSAVEVAPDLLIVAVAIGFTLGLAFWFSPFGWITYGPRLAVPLLPALLVLALERLRGTIAVAARIGKGALLGIGLGSSTILQSGGARAWWPGVLELIKPDAQCRSMLQYSVQENLDEYYRCTQHNMWRLHPAILDGAATAGGPGAAASRLCAAIACAALGWIAVRYLEPSSLGDGAGPGAVDATSDGIPQGTAYAASPGSA